ncbi:MAG: hypothetical protein V7K67_08650, partial [Nostoc sp.]|uniref:hypothetical protein n=1 Tax=Nostoc sp. TaxID=1180 RepID=UPI002FFB8565
ILFASCPIFYDPKCTYFLSYFFSLPLLTERIQKYDRLIIYVLLEKQNSYSNKEINKIIQGKLNFNPKQDILDYRDVLKAINQFQI